MGMNVEGGESSGGLFARQGLLTEINVTPFVDVMLVLLIILMVAAPFAVSGVGVQLPSAKAKSMSLGGNPLVLSITQTGQFYVGKSPVNSKDLVDKLKTAKGQEKESSIFIRADKTVPYGKVMEAMAASQRAGIHKIGMLGESSAERN
jgi:biopolymer transport protein TolR